jgi:hypothetical protein
MKIVMKQPPKMNQNFIGTLCASQWIVTLFGNPILLELTGIKPLSTARIWRDC